jgi:hypothetical protein
LYLGDDPSTLTVPEPETIEDDLEGDIGKDAYIVFDADTEVMLSLVGERHESFATQTRVEIATVLRIPQKAIKVARLAPFPPARSRSVTSVSISHDEIPLGETPQHYILQLMMATDNPHSTIHSGTVLQRSVGVACMTPGGTTIGSLNSNAQKIGGVSQGFSVWGLGIKD